MPGGGRHVIVTSGPTHEPIDPVRYIANRSSGRQGTAIAAPGELRHRAGRGAAPAGVTVIRIETAREMLAAVEAALPADAAVFAAAVADWHVANAAASKIKKAATGTGTGPELRFAENPDILRTIATRTEGRPRLVVGFAAETDDLLAHARAKLQRKGADWIVANDVRAGTGIMGGTENAVTLLTAERAEAWPRMSKDATAERLADRIAAALQ